MYVEITFYSRMLLFNIIAILSCSQDAVLKFSFVGTPLSDGMAPDILSFYFISEGRYDIPFLTITCLRISLRRLSGFWKGFGGYSNSKWEFIPVCVVIITNERWTVVYRKLCKLYTCVASTFFILDFSLIRNNASVRLARFVRNRRRVLAATAIQGSDCFAKLYDLRTATGHAWPFKLRGGTNGGIFHWFDSVFNISILENTKAFKIAIDNGRLQKFAK